MPARNLEVEESLHHDLARDGAGESRTLSCSEQCDAEKNGSHCAADQRIQQAIRILDLGDVPVTGPMERRGGKRQDRGVDEQRDGKRDDRIDRRQANSVAPAGLVLAESPRLDDRGVQVQVVGHDGCAEDADGQIEHLRIAGDRCSGHEASKHAPPLRLRQHELGHVARADRRDQTQHDGFDLTNGNPGQQGDAEQQVQCERAAQHFCEVAGNDGDLGHQPQHSGRLRTVTVSASPREVLSGDEAQAQTERLQQDRRKA